MGFQKFAARGCAWAVWVGCLLLSACATTAPVASVGSHAVAVRVHRAADDTLNAYTLPAVQAVLASVRQTLSLRGIDVQFDVQTPVQVDEAWDDLYTQDIVRLSRKIRQDDDKALHIFITNKIWNCGGVSTQTPVILGCTPVGSPVVVVQGIAEGAVDNYGTSDSILWLHEMGHSVQLGHAASALRVMTPAPQKFSNQLEAYEVRQFMYLGDQLRAQVVMGAAVAVTPQAQSEPQPQPEVDVLAHVRHAGLHGLDLGPMQHLSDAQLLPLSQLLVDGEAPGTQAQALAVLGQLGGPQSLKVVVDYIQRKPATAQWALKEVAVIALAKNENPEVAAQATALVIQATRPSYWCAEDALADEQKACYRLARVGIGALAQSQQPQAMAHLEKLAQPVETPSIHAMLQGRLGLIAASKPISPAAHALDAQWETSSRQAAQKFLRKHTSTP